MLEKLLQPFIGSQLRKKVVVHILSNPILIGKMASIARLLVFVQDNLTFHVHLSSAVSPHEAFCSDMATIFVYQYRSLICLQYMVTIHFFMQLIIEDCKVSARTLDCPVRHVLPWDMQIITYKLLLLAIKWDGIDIFCVYHCRF